MGDFHEGGLEASGLPTSEFQQRLQLVLVWPHEGCAFEFWGLVWVPGNLSGVGWGEAGWAGWVGVWVC